MLNVELLNWSQRSQKLYILVIRLKGTISSNMFLEKPRNCCQMLKKKYHLRVRQIGNSIIHRWIFISKYWDEFKCNDNYFKWMLCKKIYSAKITSKVVGSISQLGKLFTHETTNTKVNIRSWDKIVAVKNYINFHQSRSTNAASQWMSYIRSIGVF